MSLIYLAALVAVAGTILALALDAVVSVSRKPSWQVATGRLALVETVDRRSHQLPFVGVDRRRGEDAAEAPESERKTG